MIQGIYRTWCEECRHVIVRFFVLILTYFGRVPLKYARNTVNRALEWRLNVGEISARLFGRAWLEMSKLDKRAESSRKNFQVWEQVSCTGQPVSPRREKTTKQPACRLLRCPALVFKFPGAQPTTDWDESTMNDVKCWVTLQWTFRLPPFFFFFKVILNFVWRNFDCFFFSVSSLKELCN